VIYSNKFRNLETAVKKYVYSDEKRADKYNGHHTRSRHTVEKNSKRKLK